MPEKFTRKLGLKSVASHNTQFQLGKETYLQAKAYQCKNLLEDFSPLFCVYRLYLTLKNLLEAYEQMKIDRQVGTVNNKSFTVRKLSRFWWIFSKPRKFSLLNFCSTES